MEKASWHQLEGIVSSLNVKYFKNDSEYKIKIFPAKEMYA